MKQINPAYIRAVAGEVNKCPYFTLLSMEIKDLQWSHASLEVAVGEKHMQPFGLVHGGVFASLIDAAAFWAVYSRIEGSIGMTTVEMKLNYLAPAKSGRLIATGRSIKAGKTLALGEASIEDTEGRLLAHGLVTFMLVKDLSMDGSDFPSKYL
jgi:uncharacterized protein (TIGR00369 family)